MIAPNRLPDPDVPTATATSLSEREVIAGYRIHPFASRFPLLQGQQFDEMVESIADLGIDVPIEMLAGLVTDGRNRLRAVEVLRGRGIEVEVRTLEWEPRDGRSVEEHIFARNVLRRHLTDDQRAILATEILPIIRAENAARQAASRFGAANRTSAPPDGNGETPARTNRDRVAASTLGRLARRANVSDHKMGRAIELADDIAAGLVPEEERDAVICGDIPLRKAGRKKPRRPAAKADTVRVAAVDDLFDSTGDEDESNAPTLEDFIRRWERVKAAYAVTEHRELRAIALRHIADEQRRFDQR
jgi:hypothetical protein